ncbi:MAG: pseudouridine-5'-phosphate glycosidase [Oscillospiraceae bacterium]
MNLREMLQISPAVLSAYEKGNPIVAISSSEIFNVSDGGTLLNEVSDTIIANGCVPALMYINNGKLCVGANDKDIELLQKHQSKNISISHLPLALCENICACVECSAAILMASLTDIFVVSGTYIGEAHSTNIHQNIAALRAYPTLLVGCGSENLCNVMQEHTLPAYKISKSENEVFLCDSAYLGYEKLAEVCRTKWALGITSGIGAILDNEPELKFAALTCAEASAKLAKLISH